MRTKKTRRIGLEVTFARPELLIALIWSVGMARITSRLPLSSSAICVVSSGMVTYLNCLNAGFGPQYSSLRSARMYWSRFHSTNLYGPVPTTFSASQSSPFSLAAFGGMNWKFWSRSTKTGYGDVVWTRTLCSLITSTPLIASWFPFCWLFWSGLITRSQLYFTASALNGSPLWNLTSLRSSSSQAVGVAGVQEVARWGTIRLVLGSRTPRLSLTW